MRAVLTTVAAGAMVFGSMGAMAQAATAAPLADAYPCGDQWYHSGQRVYVQYCPDWAPNKSIPVYGENTPDSPVVGHIYAPGDDWYVCGWTGVELRAHGAKNHWWALTVADNGAAGWVNQIYFRGGGNNESDGRLVTCPFGNSPSKSGQPTLKSGKRALEITVAGTRS